MANIVMPKLGLTMTEGLVSEWRIKAGEAFKVGDVLLIVETEKVANEVEADTDGILEEILVAEGETVDVGTAIARVAGESERNKRSDDNTGSKGAKGDEAGEAGAAKPAESVDAAVPDVGDTTVRRRSDRRIVATPLARRLAALKNVNLDALTGSGPGGRIKARDVHGAASSSSVENSVPVNGVCKRPVDAGRAAIARKVASAKREIPHFYLTRHVEVTALQQLRGDLNSAGKDGQSRISVTHMLVKALALALTDMPEMNCIWAEQEILSFESVDIGIVSETAHGLRIPVLRDVQALSLDQVSAAAQAVAARIASNSLAPTDVGGGAISISNVGMFGADSLTPIISAPQSMILGVGAEQHLFRPDANGAPRLCREIILTLAADHRVIDGADAARFLGLTAEYLEKPGRLMRLQS